MKEQKLNCNMLILLVDYKYNVSQMSVNNCVDYNFTNLKTDKNLQ